MIRAIIFSIALFSAASSKTFISSGFESINIDGEHVQCGNLICPPGSTGCVLKTKNNEINNTLVDVTRRCLGPHQTITAEQKEQFEAKDGEQYDSYSSVSNDHGSIVSIGNNNVYTNKEANQLAERINYEVQTRLDEAMRDLRKQLNDLGVTI